MSVTCLASGAYIKPIDKLLDTLLVTRQVLCCRRHRAKGAIPNLRTLLFSIRQLNVTQFPGNLQPNLDRVG
jgi:hypothetical protein